MADGTFSDVPGLKSPYLKVGASPETHNQRRTGFPKNSLTHIGTALIGGGAFGALLGMLEARILNHIINRSKISIRLGMLVVIYEVLESGISLLRPRDDKANTVLAATASGYIFGSANGFRSMVYGGGAGLCAGMALALWNGKGEVWSEWKSVTRKFIEELNTK